jgi:3-methyl-2-oxobutanoate hydroxymethyltransferase
MKDLQEMKARGEKILYACPWDYTSTRIAEEAGADLVGIGGASTVMMLGGQPHGLSATMEGVIALVKNVAPAIRHAVLNVALPFGSFQVSNEQAVSNAILLVKAGAHCVKAQVFGESCERAQAIIKAGIPFQGHVGMLPQLYYKRGGFRSYGKTADEAWEIFENCRILQEMGASGIEMECVPARVAAEISRRLTIPVFGIGSGPGTDGQILVLVDVFGFQQSLPVKFAKRYLDMWSLCLDAMKKSVADVRSGEFPKTENTFTIKDEEFSKFLDRVH